jgi:protoporphyrinogen oxidase
MTSTDILILGAGPTGLGAALRCRDAGASYEVLEAENEAGGLASSFVDPAGFTWDLGGHVQFSHYERFDRLMDEALGPEGWLQHPRESWIWIRRRWVPYPFQYNLHRLDAADQEGCLRGLEAAKGGVAASFGEWIDRSFGEGIAEMFLRPYNFKVWAYPPEEMDAQWVGERVAPPDLNKVRASLASGEDHKSWGPNAMFRFPKRGGTGAVWNAVAAMLPPERLHFRENVSHIDPAARCVTTTSGTQMCYRRLISTLPLNRLISLCPGVVPETEAKALRYSSTHIVGVGLAGQVPDHLRGKCWMYFPESNSPYYRVTVFSHYSPHNVPEPGRQWSLMTETAESPAKPVDAAGLIEFTLRALREDGLIPEGTELLSTVHRRLPQGYPTPFLGRDGRVDPLLRAFETRDIYSRGRFGAWKYEVSNQDHAWAQGWECADRLLAGGGSEREPTLHRPNWVNSRRNP